MQISQLIRARGLRWRVLEVRCYDDCQVVTAVCVTPAHVGIARRFLAPFDTLAPIERRARPRIVPAARWRAICRTLLASNRPPARLKVATRARIDLLPHQLEPALAILRGDATRALLADEVGLGKTIQAGLVCAELIERGAIDRVLILTPAGLKDQWSRELADRFSITAVPLDAAGLRRLSATLPVGMNPWIAQTIAIASIDYIKRPEVLPAVSDCLWDMVIVDEAHGVCGESDRQAAVNALGARASYLLLLTATPHSGNRHAFLSLCDVGMLENDPLLIFRRTRADVMVGPPRRIHIRRVPPNADERRMYERLNAYAAAIRRERGELRDAAWLALAVLHKRAFSSAWSLAQSVERRLAALAPTVRSNGDQIPLPFDDGEADAATEDEPPAWPEELALASPAHEHAILMGLAASARAASECQTKTATLDRLLRRTHESAIVFTEYRDTLLHIAERVPVPHVLIHGGLTVREREMAVDIFSRAPRMILLATDAAGEGLNLQRRCRLVINLELPWNPMRLEQRIGRVDRIGQNRRVHAVHLVAQGTGEEEILRRLKTRVAAAQADIGSANPVGTLDDVEAMRSIAGENR